MNTQEFLELLKTTKLYKIDNGEIEEWDIIAIYGERKGEKLEIRLYNTYHTYGFDLNRDFFTNKKDLEAEHKNRIQKVIDDMELEIERLTAVLEEMDGGDNG